MNAYIRRRKIQRELQEKAKKVIQNDDNQLQNSVDGRNEIEEDKLATTSNSAPMKNDDEDDDKKLRSLLLRELVCVKMRQLCL